MSIPMSIPSHHPWLTLLVSIPSTACPPYGTHGDDRASPWGRRAARCHLHPVLLRSSHPGSHSDFFCAKATGLGLVWVGCAGGCCYQIDAMKSLLPYPAFLRCPMASGAMGSAECLQFRGTSAGPLCRQNLQHRARPALQTSKGLCHYHCKAIISTSGKICFYICIKYT